jgi:CelD/BcsL family acetyltransferase involved in cellulose biosynthesis
MRTPQWLLSWWNQYGGPPKELSVLLIEDGPTLVGVAPLFSDAPGRQCIYRLMGSGEVCSDHVTWFSRAGQATAVGEAVGRYLVQNKVWKRLQLEAVDEHDVAMEASLRLLERNGCLVERSATVSCWEIDVPETWDDFLSVLSKSHRKRCKRLWREYFASGRVKVHMAETEDDFEIAWTTLLQLHAKRWATATRPGGVFDEPRFRGFHETVARQLLKDGQLRLAWLECDGLPIAAEYQLMNETTLFAYQSGMDPTQGGVQPGNLSLMATIQFAIDRKLKTIDLLRGDEPYKAHWRATPSACSDIRVWPGRVTDHVEKAICGARTLAKAWLRGG